jgi:hypothetical protein
VIILLRGSFASCPGGLHWDASSLGHILFQDLAPNRREKHGTEFETESNFFPEGPAPGRCDCTLKRGRFLSDQVYPEIGAPAFQIRMERIMRGTGTAQRY